jgi:hypothetical protein
MQQNSKHLTPGDFKLSGGDNVHHVDGSFSQLWDFAGDRWYRYARQHRVRAKPSFARHGRFAVATAA